MATKYYDDGTYTKGDGKLYYPGLGVVGTDKNSSSGSTNKTTTTTTTTTTSNNKGSGISSMYQNKPSTSSSSSTSILDKMMDNVTSNPVSSSGSSSNVNKTNSGWYVPSSSTNTTVVEEVKEEVNPYEEEYRQLQEAYKRQEELLREQNRLAVEQGVNRLNSQKENVNQSADENARQAYIMHMQAQKALPQQLASQGITGGATETANLGLQSTYQNNVNAINQNKMNALQDIDNAIVDLQNTGDLSTVEQVLANNQAALNAYMSNLDKQVGYNQWAQQFNANREDTVAEQAYRDKVYADQMAQQQLENQWYVNSTKDAKAKEETNRVISLLENGLVDASYASTLLGVPASQLQDFVDYIKKARALELSNTQSLISNRNSETKKASDKGNQTYTQVLSAIQDINTTAGEDHSENLAAARYLLNSDLTMPNVISIMKQTNVRPEAFVREMVNEGLSDEDVKAFVEAYKKNMFALLGKPGYEI